VREDVWEEGRGGRGWAGARGRRLVEVDFAAGVGREANAETGVEGWLLVDGPLDAQEADAGKRGAAKKYCF
jgi:hypothetical protein